MDNVINIKHFFEKLNFKFGKNLKPIILTFREAELTDKLQNKIYFYENSSNANTAFYLFDDIDLTDEDIKIIHKRVWNENRADLFIIYGRENKKVDIYYGKTPPKVNEKPIEIDSIPTNYDDKKLLEKIDKANFDSGAFWLNYQEALKEIKKRGETVDKSLIKSLKYLRKKLNEAYSDIIYDEQEKSVIIQALIDRTLFIKFLEDRGIINSHFYGHFFKNNSLDYKTLLRNNNQPSQINDLFKNINLICNNILFAEPYIKKSYLTQDILNLLYNAIAQTAPNDRFRQLSLFDFEFDIIPVEFISRIYEIFLEDKQKSEGIYYTPQGLAKLIINAVIPENEVGKVLDPACGSGVFLVLALRKMIKTANIASEQNVYNIIKERNHFLKKNIFGIEKEEAARRLAIFSLYLEILNDIEPNKIKKLIEDKIKDKTFKLFPDNFYKNIVLGNTLETDPNKQILIDKKFDFIVGNPPWRKIESDDEENSYWLQHQKAFSGEKQASQFFLHKIQDWANINTKFGFVVNSSIFHNEKDTFQSFFYNAYNIDKFYELSHVKNILFENAKEPASVVIFSKSNNNTNNKIKYLCPNLTEFAKKFKTILLREDDLILISQKDIIEKKIGFRDFLFGIEDKTLCDSILKSGNNIELLGLSSNSGSIRGAQLAGQDKVKQYFGIDKQELKASQDKYYNEFIKDHSSPTSAPNYPYAFLKPNMIEKFKIVYENVELYLGENIKWCERPRDEKLYEGKKILIRYNNKKLSAVFVKEKIYSDLHLYIIKLKPEYEYYYYVILAILNSTIAEYLLHIKFFKRLTASYPRINKEDIFNLPIPKHIPKDTYKQIEKLTKNITSGKYTYEEKKEELDQIVFDIYGLNIVERDRILDFFKKGKVTEQEIKKYCKIFETVFRPYLKKDVNLIFEYYLNKNSSSINFVGVKILFKKGEKRNKRPAISKAVKYIDLDLLKSSAGKNILTFKEKLYGDNCMYIIREKNKKSWTPTKAIEDAQDFIKKVCK
ncbi:MAG: N-6 DNA methylase [Deltaproteobacteria bacterium]|nr:N-6 DNA methylase [Deltaproteobacteria bacterium]